MKESLFARSAALMSARKFYRRAAMPSMQRSPRRSHRWSSTRSSCGLGGMGSSSFHAENGTNGMIDFHARAGSGVTPNVDERRGAARKFRDIRFSRISGELGYTSILTPEPSRALVKCIAGSAPNRSIRWWRLL